MILPPSRPASFVDDVITLDLAKRSRVDDREGLASDDSRHG